MLEQVHGKEKKTGQHLDMVHRGQMTDPPRAGPSLDAVH